MLKVVNNGYEKFSLHTKCCEVLSLIKKLLTGFVHLVKFSHTGNLEVYHAIVNKYCPKRQHFSYRGMICRTQLAALDHNPGAFLKHAKTKGGLLSYYLAFPKQGKSWLAKPTRTNITLTRWLIES